VTQGGPHVIGVIGGMGPAAAIEFCRILLELDPAETDQEHLRVILDNNCSIPNRADALLGDGEDPAPELIRTARGLTAAGADILAIPCNTAHAWYRQVRAATGNDVLFPSIIESTIYECSRRVPGLRAAGLLASAGTIQAGLYQKASGEDIEIIVPPPNIQETVSAAIADVKAGRIAEATAALLPAAGELADRGAQLIIAGCTEVPLAISDGALAVPLIDSIRALAARVMSLARDPA